MPNAVLLSDYGRCFNTFSILTCPWPRCEIPLELEEADAKASGCPVTYQHLSEMTRLLGNGTKPPHVDYGCHKRGVLREGVQAVCRDGCCPGNHAESNESPGEKDSDPVERMLKGLTVQDQTHKAD